jgi:hypothetical protein
MKPIAARLLAVVAVLVAGGLTLVGAASGPIAQPDRLVILSTTDVKGRTGPCG